MDYGVFVKLEDGVEGLIHNSELSWVQKNIQPSKVLSVSQKISVKIVSIDTSAKRISLSYKDTKENPWKKIEAQIGEIIEVKIKNITDKAIFATLESGLVGYIHFKEISFRENEEDLKKFNKNDIIKVKLIDAKDEKIRLSIRACEKDPLDWFKENNKKVGDIVTTTVQETMKNGVKVSVGNDRNLIVTIKKSQLAKELSDQRSEIFQPGNKLDAAIVELDLKSRKVSLSVKQAQILEEKNLVRKFGKDAKTSGATLKDIFNKALNITGKKKKENKE